MARVGAPGGVKADGRAIYRQRPDTAVRGNHTRPIRRRVPGGGAYGIPHR